MDNDNGIIHIWELPDKINDINKTKDYTVIHDGSTLKKIVFEKLYEYFNQNYKVNNMITFFETLFGNENERLEELYTNLDGSLETYEDIIKNFIDEFTVNKDNIRQLERDTNQNSIDIENILKSFKNISNRNNWLSDDFEITNNSVASLNSQNNININNTSNVYDLSTTVGFIKSDIENTHSSISKSINNVSKDINTRVDEDGQILTKNINDVYDKFLAIFDHYKHIHDEEII